MLSDGRGKHILEVHAHNEQWSFVNGGAEVCSILFMTRRPSLYSSVCLRPVKGRYVSVTFGGDLWGLFNFEVTIYSKCKYISSFKC